MVFAYACIHTYVPGTYVRVCVCIESKAAHRANSALHLPVQHFRGFPEVRAHESNLKLFSTAILKPCKGTPMHSTILKQTCDIVSDASAWGRDLRPATQFLSYHLGPPATRCLYAWPALSRRRHGHQHTLGRKTANCASSDSTSCGRRRHPRRTRTPRGDPSNVHVQRRCRAADETPRGNPGNSVGGAAHPQEAHKEGTHGRRRHPRRTRTPRGDPSNVHVRRRCRRRNTSGKPR
jgi:hypothetical protein